MLHKIDIMWIERKPETVVIVRHPLLAPFIEMWLAWRHPFQRVCRHNGWKTNMISAERLAQMMDDFMLVRPSRW